MTKHPKSFTLLELIIAMSIFSVIAGAAGLYLGSGLNLWEKGLTYATLTNDLRLALDWIERDIRAAISLSSDDPKELKLTLSSDLAIRYYLDPPSTGSTLMRSVISSGVITTEPLLRHIRYLSFREIPGGELLNISIRISFKNNTQQLSQNIRVPE